MNERQSPNYFTGWQKKFDVFGDATRTEFWSFMLGNLATIGTLALAVWTLAPEDGDQPVIERPLSVLAVILAFFMIAFSLAVVIPTFTVLVRRVNDAIGSSWWWLLWFIPVIGILMLLVITVMPSRDRVQGRGYLALEASNDHPDPQPAVLAEESGPCSAWKRPFDFRGRATRTEFWCYVLGGCIAPLVIAVTCATSYELNVPALAEDQLNPIETWFAFFSLILWFPHLSLSVRRARDATGYGWLGILMLIPLGALIIGLIPSRANADS